MPHRYTAGGGALVESEHRIRRAVYTPLAPLAATAWVSAEPLPFARRRDGREMRLKPGDRWSAAPFDCAWFLFEGRVPQRAAGAQVVLLIDVNGEGCVVDRDGSPLLGLTSASSTFSRQHGDAGKGVVPFRASAEGGEAVEVWVEAGANDLFGVRQGDGRLAEAAIARRDPLFHALQYDFAVLHELLQELPAESERAAALRAALADAAALLPDAAAARAVLAPLLMACGGQRSLAISAVGHAHMDLAWLWPMRETVRKAGRTFATALALLERYPAYVFGASQPQQYDWVKGRYPALYARVKQAVAAGRWEVQGAMWVEPDINLPAGESLVRQILYGKRFFREEFGRDPNCLWLPDTFGFSGSLPQLMAKSGIGCFMTQKLSWSWVTRHPYHTFWWEGIDGSRVLAHMPPEATYNSAAGPHAVLAAARNFTQKSVSDQCLLLFGIGDGGGGPGEEHLERLQRETDLAGLPPVAQQPATAFFEHIAAGGERYPTWSGELYLERHQGTYTTQGRIKRANRRLEGALRELELAAALAAAFAARPYPHAALERIWKEALLHQFHDILPGSSIARVYDEALPRYEALLAETATLTAAADRALCREIDGGAAARPLIVANSLSWERAEWLKHDDAWLRPLVPSLGYAVVDAACGDSFTPPVAERRRLENDKLRVLFNRDGTIASCFDKEAGREVLSAGAAGNVLAIYRDTGDAWDIPMDYRAQAPERFRLYGVAPIADGPRAAIRQTYRFGASLLRQEVALHAGSRRLDFVTAVDWREDGRMLRTSFPVAVATRTAICDIQFGAIARPTHCDTPADFAKFEVCAHKWADLSDGGYGVALLNDGKYGHHLRGNLLDLALLRSPSYPDPGADRGRHEFTYALYPHPGDHASGGVARAGYALNMPLRVMAGAPGGGRLPLRRSWLRPAAANVVVETVKQAEDGRGLVVRLYEAAGAATRTVLQCGFPLAAAEAIDLIEEHPAPLACEDSALALDFTPFAIRTLRLVAGGA
jgi:alpha-mannosidase